MFYIKLIVTLVWFVLCCLFAMVVGIVLLRNPTAGHVFSSLFTWGVSVITGVKVHVNHRERLLENQPCVYVGNHQSNLDIVIQANCFMPRTVCIGKKEVLYIPFFGLLFFVTGNILIDRKNHENAMRGMAKAREFLVRKKISVFMFPEGTRNKEATTLLPFKKGAFHLAVATQFPIVPTVSCPVRNFIDFKNRKIYPGTASIEVLEPIPTKGLTENDIDGLIALTYERMQAAYEKLSNV